MGDIEGRLVEKRMLNPKLLLARVALPGNFTFQAGQYVTLLLPLKEGGVYERPFSIASSPTGSGEVEFLVGRKTGSKGAQFFEEASEGATLTLRGPYGTMLAPLGSRPLHFIASGMGVAPFRAICQELYKKQYQSSVRVTHVREPGSWGVWDEELAHWHHSWKNFSYSTVHTSVEQATHPQWQWRHLSLGNPDHNEVLYISGSSEFVQSLKAELLTRGFESEQIITENL